MSNSYPSRRELRLRREREERAKLRDEEAQRWAAEREKREVLATEPEDVEPEVEQPTDLEDTGSFGRRAAASPIDAPSDVEEDATDAALGTRRRRRADSEVTSTGMIPIISKPREKEAADRSLSRREVRELEARRAAERRAEVARLQRVQDQLAEPKPARRATSPQTTPISLPPLEPPVTPAAPTQPEEIAREEIDVSLGDSFTESAAEITDMSGLDTIEIRRAELRAETERLTREIMEMGQANPNVIDPVMLRRQKELAEKSKELQDLETAAIAIVEESEREQTPSDTAELQDPTSGEPQQAELLITTPDTTPVESDDQSQTADDVEETLTPNKPVPDTKLVKNEQKKPARRRPRRAQSAPLISGPFEVDHNAERAEKPAPVPSAELLEELQRPVKSSSGEPVDASQAHGLDSLDAKDFEAPERRLVLSSAIVFAIGIIALITAIILLIR